MTLTSTSLQENSACSLSPCCQSTYTAHTRNLGAKVPDRILNRLSVCICVWFGLFCTFLVISLGLQPLSHLLQGKSDTAPVPTKLPGEFVISTTFNPRRNSLVKEPWILKVFTALRQKLLRLRLFRSSLKRKQKPRDWSEFRWISGTMWNLHVQSQPQIIFHLTVG